MLCAALTRPGDRFAAVLGNGRSPSARPDVGARLNVDGFTGVNRRDIAQIRLELCPSEGLIVTLWSHQQGRYYSRGYEPARRTLDRLATPGRGGIVKLVHDVRLPGPVATAAHQWLSRALGQP